MNVSWSDHAIDQLRGHIRYIAENSDLETASRWHFRLNEATALLETFPSMCPLSSFPDLAAAGIHEMTFETYRVFYVIHADECRIISILGGRRNITGVGDL